MKRIKNNTYSGERPLFKTFDAEIENCKFMAGESCVKESKNLKVYKCHFEGKYPFWHNSDIIVKNSYFADGGRAGIWYVNNVELFCCKVDAPKIFRDSEGIIVRESTVNTDESLWDCKDITVEYSDFKGDYLMFHSRDFNFSNFRLDGNYSFQHAHNGIIKDSILNSKDALWNSKNITVYNSVLNGEYLGWYSENLKLVNCKIIGTQPLCYAKNLVMENCKMEKVDLCFEYSTLYAEITSEIESIKNPVRGFIKAKAIGELIRDDESLNISDCQINIEKEECACNTISEK